MSSTYIQAIKLDDYSILLGSGIDTAHATTRMGPLLADAYVEANCKVVKNEFQCNADTRILDSADASLQSFGGEVELGLELPAVAKLHGNAHIDYDKSGTSQSLSRAFLWRAEVTKERISLDAVTKKDIVMNEYETWTHLITEKVHGRKIAGCMTLRRKKKSEGLEAKGELRAHLLAIPIDGKGSADFKFDIINDLFDFECIVKFVGKTPSCEVCSDVGQFMRLVDGFVRTTPADDNLGVIGFGATPLHGLKVFPRATALCVEKMRLIKEAKVLRVKAGLAKMHFISKIEPVAASDSALQQAVHKIIKHIEEVDRKLLDAIVSATDGKTALLKAAVDGADGLEGVSDTRAWLMIKDGLEMKRRFEECLAKVEVKVEADRKVCEAMKQTGEQLRDIHAGAVHFSTVDDCRRNTLARAAAQGNVQRFDECVKETKNSDRVRKLKELATKCNIWKKDFAKWEDKHENGYAAWVHEESSKLLLKLAETIEAIDQDR